MISLPKFKNAFEYENSFFLSCEYSRLGKLFAHYELYKMVQDLPGTIVECGVFKGISFTRLVMIRELIENQYSRKIIGFDTFGEFPETEFNEDKEIRRRFIETAGKDSISCNQLMDVLKHKKVDKNVELIEGDITETVPNYIKAHPEMRISLLHLDVDIYEPSVTVLEHLFPIIVRGGVLVLDDYGTFPGETKAVDDYFKELDIRIEKFPFCQTPAYLIKR